MKTILNAILTKLEDVESLQYIDENWNQLSTLSDIPVKFPCALVDFRIVDKEEYLNLAQRGTYYVEIVVAHKKTTNTSFRAPSAQREKAFEIYDIVDEIHETLHGWSPTVNSGRMYDKTLSKEFQQGIKKMVMIFEVKHTKEKTNNMVPVQVGLNVETLED